MNIIEWLTEDHDRLRRELVRIKNSIGHGDLRSQIRNFMVSYEFHESVEEEILFPKVSTLGEETIEHESLFGFEQLHTKIWTLLDHLMATLSTNDAKVIQKAFFEFDALTEAHFRYEERVLFPAALKHFDRPALEEMGKRVEGRLTRFMTI